MKKDVFVLRGQRDWMAGLLLFCLLASQTAAPAWAQILVELDGCRLNDAVVAANTDTATGQCPAGDPGPDEIVIDSAGGIQALVLSSELLITSDITIEPNDGQRVTLRGPAGGGRVFHVDGGDLTLSNVRIEDGIVTDSGSPQTRGGGLRVIDGTAVLSDCIFFNNFLSDTSSNGGGDAIYAENSIIELSDCQFAQNGPPEIGSDGYMINVLGTFMTMTRVETRGPNASGSNPNIGNRNALLRADEGSTISVRESGLFATRAEIFGLEIFIGANTMMEVINSTLGSFLPEGAGSEVPSTFRFRGSSPAAEDRPSFTFLNSTLSANTFYDRVAGPASATVEYSNTLLLSAPNPLLPQDPDSPTLPVAVGTLQDNGGPIETMALFWNSAAVNAGNDVVCPAIDQRGENRIRCDAGAFEFIADSDVSITIVPVTPGPYAVGETVQIDVVIDNAGPDTANGIQVDISAQNFDIDSVDGACVSTNCGLFALEADNPALPFQVARVTGRPTASGQNNFNLTATASPGAGAVYTELDNGNNSDSLTLPLVQNADLEITKTLSTPPPYAIGDAITYDITITNNGPDFADDVIFTDIPEGLNITSINGCSNPPAGPCALADLNSGSSVNFTVNAQITQARFDNTGQVSSNTFDADPSNNIDARNNGADVSADADTQIALNRLTNPPFFTGQTVEYVIRLGNAGPDSATDVTFDLETENFFPTAVLGPCNPIGSLPCNVGSLAAGGGVDITVQGFAVAPGPSGFLARVDSDQLDPMLPNNLADASFSVVESADVSVELQIDQASTFYAVDQLVTYTGRIRNAGDDYADNVELQLQVNNLEVVGVFSDSCTGLPCTIPTLARPAEESLVIQARIQGPGPFDLTATVDADQFDPVPTNNIDDEGNGGTATINTEDSIFSDRFQ